MNLKCEKIEATYGRVTFAFCEDCLHRLQSNPKDKNWLFPWVAGITLLSTVLDAIKNVDSKRNAYIKASNNELFKEVKEFKDEEDIEGRHTIFWKFIREYRNNLVHQLELGATNFTTEVIEGQKVEFFILTHGVYSGRDQREVFLEAMKWLEWYLDEVEMRAKLNYSEAIKKSKDDK